MRHIFISLTYLFVRKKTSFWCLKLLIMTIAFNLVNGMGMMLQKTYAQDAIELIKPAQGTMVFSKKPEIECKILVPFDKESLTIEFDYTDMTGLAEITESKVTFRPVQVVDPGEHTITISFVDENNQDVSQEFNFSTRHSKAFETISSTNKLTGIYTYLVEKKDDANDRQLNDWTIQSNLNSQNIIAEGPWEVGFQTDLRYLDQDFAIEDPLKKGIEVTDYTFIGKYEKDNVLVNTALGDVSIDESRNTVNYLSRRGANIVAEVGPVYLSSFVVRSDIAYGIDGDEGLDIDNADHIYGGAAGIKLFDNKMDIKTIYASGGEKSEDDSYGIWPAPGGSTGDVYGVRVITDFFEDKCRTLFEWDRSDYDSDTADALASKSEIAWFAEAGGTIGIFNYQTSYEHTGPDYKVTGNDGVQADWEGFALETSLNFETMSFNGHYNQHNNNVDEMPTESQIESTDFGLGYTIDPLSWLSIDASWDRAIEDSSMEPAGTSETLNYTDSFQGSITLTKDTWSISLAPSYSTADDRTSIDYDTNTKSLGIDCSYDVERFSFSPYVTVTRFIDESTDIKTDTYEYGLAFSVNIIEGLNFEGGGSYTREYDDNDTNNQDNYNADLKLSYDFTSPIKGFLTPSIILTLTHLNNNDEISDTDSKETIVYLILAANLDLSF